MHRYRFIFSGNSEELEVGKDIELDEDESCHLRDVLRLGVGEIVEARNLVDGVGFICKIADSARNAKIILRIQALLPKLLPKIRTHLICSILKPQTADNIVEKCTEIGVSSISFTETDYAKKEYITSIKSRKERFLRIRNSAIKQCGSNVVTELTTDDSFGHAISISSKALLKLFCASEFECTEVKGLSPRNIFEVISDMRDIKEKSLPVDSYIVIGPEGGLSSAEVNLLLSNGFTPISLGANTLRSDTAAILISGLTLAAHV